MAFTVLKVFFLLSCLFCGEIAAQDFSGWSGDENNKISSSIDDDGFEDLVTKADNLLTAIENQQIQDATSDYTVNPALNATITNAYQNFTNALNEAGTNKLLVIDCIQEYESESPIIETLASTANTSLANCWNSYVETGSDIVERLKDITTDVRNELQNLQERLKECDEQQQSILGNQLCKRAEETKATLKLMPLKSQLLLAIYNGGVYLELFPTEMSKCVYLAGAEVIQKANQIGSEVFACIRDKAMQNFLNNNQ